MTFPWNYDDIPDIPLRQSLSIYLKNNPAKFHHDPIGNDGGRIRLFWQVSIGLHLHVLELKLVKFSFLLFSTICGE